MKLKQSIFQPSTPIESTKWCPINSWMMITADLFAFLLINVVAPRRRSWFLLR